MISQPHKPYLYRSNNSEKIQQINQYLKWTYCIHQKYYIAFRALVGYWAIPLLSRNHVMRREKKEKTETPSLLCSGLLCSWRNICMEVISCFCTNRSLCKHDIHFAVNYKTVLAANCECKINSHFRKMLVDDIHFVLYSYRLAYNYG